MFVKKGENRPFKQKKVATLTPISESIENRNEKCMIKVKNFVFPTNHFQEIYVNRPKNVLTFLLFLNIYFYTAFLTRPWMT